MSKHSIQINSIICSDTSEGGVVDYDEVYLVCQSDGGYPIRVPAGVNARVKMEAGDTWTLPNLVLNFEYEVLVTLWDHDLNYDPNLATYLQSHDFLPGIGGGSVRLKNHNGADYTITFTYLD